MQQSPGFRLLRMLFHPGLCCSALSALPLFATPIILIAVRARGKGMLPYLSSLSCL